VPVVAALYGALRIHQVDARVAGAPKALIGTVQANMSLTEKRTHHDEGMIRHLRATRELTSKQKLDLVIWSETSVMGAMVDSEAADIVPRAFAARLHVPVLFGAVLAKKVGDARGYALYNSALVTDAQGQVRGRYDKQELVPFSEHMPFGHENPVPVRDFAELRHLRPRGIEPAFAVGRAQDRHFDLQRRRGARARQPRYPRHECGFTREPDQRRVVR